MSKEHIRTLLVFFPLHLRLLGAAKAKDSKTLHFVVVSMFNLILSVYLLYPWFQIQRAECGGR